MSELTTTPFLSSSVISMLAHMPMIAYVKNLQGEHVYANQAMHAFINEQGDDVQTPLALRNPTILDAESTVASSQKSQGSVKVTLLGQHHFLLTCIPWKSEAGLLQGTITMLQNITEMQIKEQELEESVNFHNIVLEHLPVRVFWKDHDLIYLGCNTVFANDMGFESPSKLIGQNDYATSMTREETEICRAEDFSVLQSGEGRFGSEEVYGEGEDQSWIRVSKVPLTDAKGKTIGVLGMYAGITEEKKAQIELENALRREKELNELKTRFISTVSHEYRNPLAAIKVSIDSLRRLSDRLDRPMREKRYAAIEVEVDQMTMLMESVLLIGREELLEAPLKYDAIDMLQLCQEFIESLNSEDSSRINIFKQGMNQPIIGVKIYLNQIIQNLITNALKYSQGTIDLKLEWTDDNLMFSVSDRGVGIPEKDQGYIFDSFFRSENVGFIHGTGLGLYITQRAVEIHKGNIKFKSEQAKGSTFWVNLPNRSRS